MADDKITEDELKDALTRMQEERVIEHVEAPEPEGAAVYMPEGMKPDTVPPGSKVTIVPSSYTISEEK